jgi:hypothetical protein
MKSSYKRPEVFTVIDMKTIGSGVPREEEKEGKKTLLGVPPRTKHLVCARLLDPKSLSHTRCFVLSLFFILLY